MITQCPACDTTFRVTAEQIRAKGGRVRCGQCQHAFNALDTLRDALSDGPRPPATERMPDRVETPQQLPEYPANPDASETFDQAGKWMKPAEFVVFPGDTLDLEKNTEDHVDHRFAAEAPSMMTSPVDASPAEDAEEAVVETSADENSTNEYSAHSQPERTLLAAQTNILLDGPFAELPSPASPHRGPWIVGSLLLLIALGAQAVVAFHISLAKTLPAAQPAITALCRIAHCTTRLPAQADLISIENSDLHPDPTKPGRLVVSATLKNRAAFSQQFPHLELTLTDIADKAILRKVLPPAAYLRPLTPIASGMLPNADIAINLVIDIDPLIANGYRLYFFYP